MLNIKRDINVQDFKIVDPYFGKSEYFLLTWSCATRQRDSTSSGWKFQLNNFKGQRVKELKKYTVSSPRMQIRASIVFYSNQSKGVIQSRYLRIK